ncbi:hypothetical protein BGW38_003044, partial [Lunasporangiospora selenospora]
RFERSNPPPGLSTMSQSTFAIPAEVQTRSQNLELRDMIEDEDYDEDEALRVAIRESIADSQRERRSLSPLNGDHSESHHGEPSRQPAHQRTSGFGGNDGQLSGDPWLSGDQETSDNAVAWREQPVFPRRRSFGRSRYDAMSLISTASPGPHWDRASVGPQHTTPRKQQRNLTSDVIEVDCSDLEELEMELPTPRQQLKTTTIRTRSTRRANSNADPGPSKRNKNRRLVKASNHPRVREIIPSSGDEQDTSLWSTRKSGELKHRPIVNELISSSEGELDELSKNNGKLTIRKNTRTSGNTRYPVANDTIAQPSTVPPPSSDIIPSSPTLLGSTSKMPWSVAEGSDGDIVLSTPKMKQRVQHYDTVQDSEEEDSGMEDPLVCWTPTRRRSSISTNHLGLPLIKSTYDGNLVYALASDSEADVELQDVAARKQDDDIPLSVKAEDDVVVEKTVHVVQSQRPNRLSKRSNSLYKDENQRKLTSKRLKKPRPLVLDVSSGTDSGLECMGSKQPTAAKIRRQENERKLKAILMFDKEATPKTREPSESPLNRRVVEVEQTKFEKSPFAMFPRLDHPVRRTADEQDQVDLVPKEEETKIAPSLSKPIKETENKRPIEQYDFQDSAGEDDEPLIDPRSRRRSGQHERPGLSSPQKKMRLSEAAPGPAVFENAIKAAVQKAQNQARIPGPPARMETIGSFSTISDSQPYGTQQHQPFNNFLTSQAEEIDDFSDDEHKKESLQDHTDRKSRRYSGLQFAELRKSDNNSAAIASPPPISQESLPSLDLQTQDYRECSPILSQDAMEKCPICSEVFTVSELMDHVEMELQAKEQEKLEELHRRDEEYAIELEKAYQTQAEPMFVVDSLDSTAHLTQSFPQLLTQTKLNFAPITHTQFDVTPPKSREAQKRAISLDTPIRKVTSLSLNSPPPKASDAGHYQHRGVGAPMASLRKKGSRVSSLTSDRGSLRREDSEVIPLTDDRASLRRDDSDIISLSDSRASLRRDYSDVIPLTDEASSLRKEGSGIISLVEDRIGPGLVPPNVEHWDLESPSCSQSAFKIQPGQRFLEDSSLSLPSSSSMGTRHRITARSKKTGSRSSGLASSAASNSKLSTGRLSAPYVVFDETIDDDLDDFLERPEPSSLVNRSFRTRSRAEGTNSSGSSRRSNIAEGKKKELIDLDDSDDEVTQLLSKPAGRRSRKLPPSVLDTVLSAPSAAHQRQGSKSQRKDQYFVTLSDDEAETEEQQVIAEKLWNPEDDPFDSESLDPRQVKGIGLGGIVGGIGALPGSLSMSKLTKSKASQVMQKDHASEDSSLVVSAQTQANSSRADQKQVQSKDGSQYQEGPFEGQSYEYEDPNYGLHSQEWWDAANPAGQRLQDPDESWSTAGGGEREDREGEDDGYNSPLGDFVDLRQRRDDPSMAMYFEQLGDDGGGDSSSKPRSKNGVGRGRGRAKGAGTRKGVSFAPGVAPFGSSADDDNNGEGSSRGHTAGRATTANGSLAIRSRPTVSSYGKGKQKK